MKWYLKTNDAVKNRWVTFQKQHETNYITATKKILTRFFNLAIIHIQKLEGISIECQPLTLPEVRAT